MTESEQITSLVERVEHFIADRDRVSIVEIGRFLDRQGIETHGDYWFEVVPNIVAWSGMSEVFADLLVELRTRCNVETKPAHPLVYFIDGRMVRLPVVKRFPKGGYKKPHWLPVTFSPKPGRGSTRGKKI
jgi:hypothetical protein